MTKSNMPEKDKVKAKKALAAYKWQDLPYPYVEPIAVQDMAKVKQELLNYNLNNKPLEIVYVAPCY
jgi:hypothetical protein